MARGATTVTDRNYGHGQSLPRIVMYIFARLYTYYTCIHKYIYIYIYANNAYIDEFGVSSEHFRKHNARAHSVEQERTHAIRSVQNFDFITN